MSKIPPAQPIPPNGPDFGVIVPFEALNYPRTVAIAREWARTIPSAEAMQDDDPEAIALFNQWAGVISHVQGYNLEGPTRQINKGQVDIATRWLAHDLGLLRLLVEEPRERNLVFFDMAAKLGATIVGNTLDKAEKEQFERLANLDEVTHLPNDRAYRRIRKDFLRRHKARVGEGLMDLTDFKEFNDVFGREVGDELLREVQDDVSRNTRASDLYVLARVGQKGDEFRLLFGGIAKDQFINFLDRIQAAQIEKVTMLANGERSPYEEAWHRVKQLAQQGVKLDAESQVVMEVIGRGEEAKKQKVLYVAGQRVAPLKDFTIIAIGGEYLSAAKSVPVMLRNAYENMKLHKGQLHHLMGGAYRVGRHSIADEQ